MIFDHQNWQSIAIDQQEIDTLTAIGAESLLLTRIFRIVSRSDDELPRVLWRRFLSDLSG
nr:hypothetical protein [Acetobacter pasteurianus]